MTTETKFTPGPWGVEQTRDMLWVGPMRPDGHKVDEVVVGLAIGPDLTVTSALKQLWNGSLIAAAPELYAVAEVTEELFRELTGKVNEAFLDRFAKVHFAARAALAKARGEA